MNVLLGTIMSYLLYSCCIIFVNHARQAKRLHGEMLVLFSCRNSFIMYDFFVEGLINDRNGSRLEIKNSVVHG